MEVVLSLLSGILVVALVVVVVLHTRAERDFRHELASFAKESLEILKAASLTEKVSTEQTRDNWNVQKQVLLDALNSEVEKSARAAKQKKAEDSTTFVRAENGKLYKPTQLEEVGPRDMEAL